MEQTLSQRYYALIQQESAMHTSAHEVESNIRLFCKEQLLGKAFKSKHDYYYIMDMTCEGETDMMLYIDYLHLSLRMLPCTNEEIQDKMDETIDGVGFTGYAIEEKGAFFDDLSFLYDGDIEVITPEVFKQEMERVYQVLRIFPINV